MARAWKRRRSGQRSVAWHRQRRWLAKCRFCGAGTAGVSGVPSGPANAGGLNNSINDPSGAGNRGKVVSQPPAGTNSLGTANSSGSSMTTGSAGSRAAGGGTAATGPQTSGDVAVDKEDKAIDKKIKSICRGC